MITRNGMRDGNGCARRLKGSRRGRRSKKPTVSTVGPEVLREEGEKEKKGGYAFKR